MKDARKIAASSSQRGDPAPARYRFMNERKGNVFSLHKRIDPGHRGCDRPRLLHLCMREPKFAHESADSSTQSAPTQVEPAAQSPDASVADASDQGRFKPCDKLSVADVQPLYRSPLTKKVEDDLIAPAYGCFFRTATHKSLLQVMTVTGDLAGRYYAESEKRDGKPGVALSGVGDKAVREPGDIWIAAMKNGVFCMVHSDHSADHAEDRVVDEMIGVDIADVRASAIPDAMAAPVAKRLGALCNKIFGS